MNTKFSKGLWHKNMGVPDINKESKRFFKSIRVSINNPLSKIVATAWGDTQDECEANANLIEHAPSLVDALKNSIELLKYYAKKHGFEEDYIDTMNQNIKTIKAATELYN